jgi:hypothetical protein
MTPGDAPLRRRVPSRRVLARRAAVATLTAGVATTGLVVLLMLPTGDMPSQPRAALVEIGALAVHNAPRAMAVACISALIGLSGPLRESTTRDIVWWAATGSGLGLMVALALRLLHGWGAIIALFVGYLLACAIVPLVQRAR